MSPRRQARRKVGRRWRWKLRLLGLLALAVGLSVAVVLPWRWIAPATSSFMLRESGERPIIQRWVPLDRISPSLAIAVVAAEDQKFPAHHGFDLQSIADSVIEDGGRRGASTITQQVAKNLFLWPDRSFVRKGIEAYLTVCIELLWPKRRILEVYLNIAEFAPGVYGAAAAAEALFGASPSRLTARESALLAAVLPSPKRMSAAAPSEYVRQRASEIQAAVDGLGGPGYLARLQR